MTKPTRVTSEDIRTLETIYADGRLLGRMVNDLKAELDAARKEGESLKTEVRTLTYRLKRVTELYERGAEQKGTPDSCKPSARADNLGAR
jgi:hypothetical protein